MITCKGLKRQFEQSGLSQNKFADSVGINPARISLLLNGKSEPRLSEIRILCEVLECQPGDIIEKED